MTNNPHDCIVKQQDNGEWRCFMCWRLFVAVDEIEAACEQVEAKELDEIKEKGK